MVKEFRASNEGLVEEETGFVQADDSPTPETIVFAPTSTKPSSHDMIPEGSSA
jgi:hypothetical protein